VAPVTHFETYCETNRETLPMSQAGPIFFFYCALVTGPERSLSLKYEPASAPLHNSVKWLCLT